MWVDFARENAEKAGVASRHSTIPGSAFDADFGSSYELVLIKKFCITSIRRPPKDSSAKCTLSELDRMLRNAGFARSEMRELSPLPQRVVVSYK